MSSPEPIHCVTLADLGSWEGGGTPSKSVPSFWAQDGIPWVTPKDMKADEIRGSEATISRRGAESTGLKLFPRGCTAVVFRSGVLRHSFPVAYGLVPFTVNQDMKVLKPNESTDTRFAFHLLHGIARTVLNVAVKSGTTVESIDFDVFKALRSPIPPLPEQRRIVEILDTLNEAIRKTEQVIAKLQKMKQGLLHDVLTRGIAENGELRDPERHPEQFKDSPLGWIPIGWEVRRLGEVVRDSRGLIQTGPFGSQLHAHEYVARGIPVIMPQDIQGDTIDLANIARITSQKAGELSRHQLRVNDLIIARRGDLSRCVAIGANAANWLCGTGCLLIRISESSIFADWLACVYRHDLGQRQVLAQAVGSTMVNLNGRILASLLVPVPPPYEQRQCLDKMGAIKSMLMAERSELQKLRNLKQGLMDDLLTGRVRVPIEPEAAAA